MANISTALAADRGLICALVAALAGLRIMRRRIPGLPGINLVHAQVLQLCGEFAEGGYMHEKHPQAQQPPIPPGAPAARGQDDHARFVWSVAGQLAAGLLANPGKQHYSVKDSISLFDEVLHELHSYARIRGDFVESAHIQVATGEQGHEAQPGATRSGPSGCAWS